MNNLNFSYRTSFFWMLFVVFFSTGFVFFKVPFEFYFHYLVIVLLAPFFLIKIGFPKFLLKIFIIPFFVGLIHVALGNNSFFTFFKIFGGLFAVTSFFYFVLAHVKFNIIEIFTIYCKGTWILCVIAIIQIISFYFDFKIGYNYSWFLNKWGFVNGGILGFRVNSILPEPTYLATVLAPSVFLSFKNLFSKSNYIFNKVQSVIIISISILTTSSIGYFGILLSILLVSKTIRLRYIVFASIISFLVFNLAYNYVEDFKQRADAAKGLWVDQDFDISNTNNSSFVLFNNLHVAKENLSIFPIFGTGLGSHETAFKKFTLTKTLIQYDFEFNVKDGNSLFVRLCTETGLIGLFLIIAFIFMGFIPKSNYEELNINVIISQSLFVLFILVLIRQGNYMLNGLPMLFLIYYYNYIDYKSFINQHSSVKNP